MRTSLTLLLLPVLCAMLSPPTATYGPSGEALHTYPTPFGAVTYDSQGRKIERYDKPEGGSIWYGEHGQTWESYPDIRTGKESAPRCR
ncbi:MAG: hypothetical protein HYZ50_12545 [Deltaproteobacteria bacterium]|nr:hypothetical protein [Deltaproteobacteria bacterium]